LKIKATDAHIVSLYSYLLTKPAQSNLFDCSLLIAYC